MSDQYYPFTKSIEYHADNLRPDSNICHTFYHYENQSDQNDVISLNVDFSYEETEDNEYLSRCPTKNPVRLELNPQKYSLELSTLSSSLSKVSSFSSISSKAQATTKSCIRNVKYSSSSIETVSETAMIDYTIKPIPKTLNSTPESSIFTSISSQLSDSSSGERNKKFTCKSSPANNFTNRSHKTLYKRSQMNLHNIQLRNRTLTACKQQEKLFKLKSIRSSCCIDALDDYLLALIFSKLNTIEKLMLQFVCKRWRHIVCSNEFTYKLFKRIDISDTNVAVYLHSLSYAKQVIAPKPFPEKKPKLFGLLCSRLARVKQQRQLSIKSEPNLLELKEHNFLKFHVNADLVLKFLLNKLLNRQTYPFCLGVEEIVVKNNHWLTDFGVELIAQRCPELSSLTLKNCSNIRTGAIIKLIAKCQNIKYLDLSGCFKINSIISRSSMLNSTRKSIYQKLNSYLSYHNDFHLLHVTNQGNYFYLQYVNLSRCSNIDDASILCITQTCVYIRALHMRKCQLITDLSVLYISKYSPHLVELSMDDCNRLTDVGIKYFANERLVEENFILKLKYLSLANCFQIGDNSLIYLCKKGFFQHIKYLNLKGCVKITDKFVKFLTGAKFIQRLQLQFRWNSVDCKSMPQLDKSIPIHMKSLNLANCSITDKSIEYICRLISINPLVMQRLCLNNCRHITDCGMQILALNCRNLQRLKVKKCPQISSKLLKSIKLNCHDCIIQHTRFSFC